MTSGHGRHLLQDRPVRAVHSDFPNLEGQEAAQVRRDHSTSARDPGRSSPTGRPRRPTTGRPTRPSTTRTGAPGLDGPPQAQFYFAGDGHDHWHVRDFDDYTLLDADGTTVARAEKHGYCMQDNTTYGPMEGQPGRPDRRRSTWRPRRAARDSPNALTIDPRAEPAAGVTPTRPPCRTRPSTSPASRTASTPCGCMPTPSARCT